MPGYTNPQNLNRYSYVTNNPLRYTDPTGHMADYGGNEGGGGCNSITCFPQAPSNSPGGGGSGNNNGSPTSTPSPLPSTTPTAIPTLSYSPYGPCIGTPISPGTYYGGFCGTGGGLVEYSTRSTVGDSIESVPLSYSARYDIDFYDNLMVVTLHEQYWIPNLTIPSADNSTFGYSALVAQLRNGKQAVTNLGDFMPGRLPYPGNRENRSTSINYFGKDNFPTQLVVRITFGAPNVRMKTVYYTLPFSP